MYTDLIDRLDADGLRHALECNMKQVATDKQEIYNLKLEIYRLEAKIHKLKREVNRWHRIMEVL